MTKNRGMVAGAGRKPFKQKGGGRARQGSVRSPINYKGGHTHSLKPKKYYFPLNKKIRLLGLKSMLSYKLLQKNIIILDEFSIQNKQNDNSSSLKLNLIRDLVKGQKALVYINDEFSENTEKKSKKENFQKNKMKEKIICLRQTSFRDLNVKALLEHKFLILFLKSNCIRIENSNK